MNLELEKTLVTEFPIIYRDMYGSMKNTCMAFGIECNDGWYNILYNLSKKLEEIAAKEDLPKEQNSFQKLGWSLISKLNNIKLPRKKNKVNRRLIGSYIPDKLYFYCFPPEDNRLKFDQIKEKFGTFRIYLNYYSDEIDRLVEEAEELSEVTCETCGRPGEMRKRGTWLLVRCDEHWEEERTL